MPPIRRATISLSLRVLLSALWLLALGAAGCGSRNDAFEDAPPITSPPANPPLETAALGPVFVPVEGSTEGVHDPVVVKQGETYHLFYTGGGIRHRTSTDLQRWIGQPDVFAPLPAWIHQELPKNRGDLWAPDVSWWGGQWHLYYAASVWLTRNSAIGHATTRSLDPRSSEFGWVDHGPVVRSAGGFFDPDISGWNAIDPNVVRDENGRPWLAWGSSFDGIFLQPLNPDGTVDGSRPPVNLARRAALTWVIEAPWIVQHEGWWFLFASYDLCCMGVNSTYNVRVGRSRSLAGPYLDRDGRDLTAGGGTKILAAYDSVIGPGHEAVLHDGPNWWLIHHWYDPARDGMSELGVRPLDWNTDGWPVARGWTVDIGLAPPAGGQP